MGQRVIGRIARWVRRVAPAVPAFVTSVQAAQSITVVWNANPEPDVASYVVYYGMASRQYVGATNVGLATSVTLSLDEGQTYYFAVSALAASGLSSELSREVSVRIPGPPTLDPIPDLTLSEDSGMQTVYLTGISPSPSSDGPALSVAATSSQPDVVYHPAVFFTPSNRTAILRFAPRANAAGTAVITVQVSDGSAANRRATRTFRVVVDPVNDPPTLDPIEPQSCLTTGGAQYVALTGLSGGPDLPSQTCRLSVFSTRPSLLPHPRVMYPATGGTNLLELTPVAGATGSVMVLVTVQDDGGTERGGIDRIWRVFRVTLVAPQQQWRTARFSADALADPTREADLWGDQADPDRDGRDNLIEYALGGDPTQVESGPFGLESSILLTDGGRYVSLSYLRRRSDPTLVYLPQVSADREHWLGAEGVLVLRVVTVTPEFEAVTVRDLVPIAAGAPRFIRLGVARAASDTAPGTLHVSESYVGLGWEVRGATEGQPQPNYLTFAVSSPVRGAGTVTDVAGVHVTDAAASWSPEILSSASRSFYVEFASGLVADLISVDAGSRTLVLASHVRDQIAVGEAYRIRRHVTLADLFGPNDEAGLQSGPSEASADTVQLLNAERQETATCYYMTRPGGSGWVRTDGVPAAGFPIAPGSGVVLFRQSSTDLALFVHGLARTGALRIPVWPGTNLVGTLQTVRAIPLSELNLYTGSLTTGFLPGPDLALADRLTYLAESGPNRCFYSSRSGFGWRNAQFRWVNGLLFLPGAGFTIERAPEAGLFLWTIPGEADALDADPAGYFSNTTRAPEQ